MHHGKGIFEVLLPIFNSFLLPLLTDFFFELDKNSIYRIYKKLFSCLVILLHSYSGKKRFYYFMSQELK